MAAPNELVDELLARLRAEGVPSGTWLVELAQARDAIRRVDTLLMHLADAIVDQASRDAA